MKPIIESRMAFGPYPDGHCFHIEKSKMYQKKQHGVRMAEFLLLRPGNGKPPSVWVVEAKSSSPRPKTQPSFDDFISEIQEKMTNALSMGLAACLGRHENAEEELPKPFKDIDLSSVSFKFILVINGHKDMWLPPLKDALHKALGPTIKTWALPPNAILVLNEDMALSNRLISPAKEAGA